MGLFSFGNKDDDAPRRRTVADKPARGEGLERRSRRAERVDAARGSDAGADAMLLDPTLPEKQRARRRLVGAIALVVAAVVLLPMVLDSHPKPVTDDISIDIPNRPATVPHNAGRGDAAADTQDSQDTQAGVAPDNPEASAAVSATGAASGVAPIATVTPQGQSADQATKPPATAATGQAATQAAKAPQLPAGSRSGQASSSASSQQTQQGQQTQQTAEARPAVAKQPAASATQVAKPAAVSARATAAAESATPADAGGARFEVELGVFADDASARVWETKLKDAGVPAYIGHRKQADGKTRTLLRAGPFADRAAASAAIAKVRDAGLTANAANAAQ
jgi:DedD protein